MVLVRRLVGLVGEDAVGLVERGVREVEDAACEIARGARRGAEVDLAVREV